MSDFKAKVHEIRFPLGSSKCSSRRPSYISGGLLLRGEMWKREEEGEERKRGKGRWQPTNIVA